MGVGGGTDIRTGKGNWDENIETRFIVAGGGGGSRLTNPVPYKGGDAGGLEGSPSNGNGGSISCYGSTIEKKCIGGYKKNNWYAEGTLGKGSDPPNQHCGGGGGGYIGGGSSDHSGGGGGSSYAGSYGSSIRAIGNLFTETSQHNGHGMAIITIVSATCAIKFHNYRSFSLLYLFINIQS